MAVGAEIRFSLGHRYALEYSCTINCGHAHLPDTCFKSTLPRPSKPSFTLTFRHTNVLPLPAADTTASGDSVDISDSFLSPLASVLEYLEDDAILMPELCVE